MVEVWQADVAQSTRDDTQWRHLLSAEENAQADRFHFESDRSRFIRRRAFRRLWLSQQLDRPAGSFRFGAGLRGKPEVQEVPAGFRINCSASGDFALLAFSTSGELGVDVEQIRPMDADLALVTGRFAPDEKRALDLLPPRSRTRIFFECWARKEAFVKAVGCGLYLPLEQFTVPLDPEVVAVPIRWPTDPVPGRAWWATSLDVGPNASAAVVSEHPVPVRLHRWTWPA